MKPHFITILLVILLIALGGCATGSPSRPVQAPAFTGAEPVPQAQEEKIVTLVPAAADTATPTAAPPPGDTPTPTPTPTAAAAAPQAASLPDLGFEPITYVDPHSGVALDYPAGWQVAEPVERETSTGYSISFISHVVDRGPKQQEGLAADQTKFDLSITQDRSYTYEDAVTDRKAAFAADDFPPTVLSEEQWLLPGGLPATLFQLDSRGTPVSLLVTAVDGRMVIFSGLGDPSVLRAIAATIRTE